MISIEQIEQIKREAENKRRMAERMKGTRDQLIKTIKAEFSVATLEEAQAKLEEMKREGQMYSTRIEKLQARVVELWNKSQGEEQ